MKDLIKYLRERPKETIKKVARCIIMFTVCCAMLFLSAIMQGCDVSKSVTVKGKTIIVTKDTTVVIHNGMLKLKKSMFNN